jgi:proteasome lid subunit RPN8/RPN11
MLKKKIVDWLKRFFGLHNYEFTRLAVKREVIDAICEFAQEAHPKEFIMLLQGKATAGTMHVNSLYYQEYYANEDSAMPYIRLPIFSDIVGSVHSHPGPSNRPSRADIHFFAKHGMVHLIIKYPYQPRDIAAYSISGKMMEFDVF